MARPEVPLEGGIANAGLVVRVGDTVRRPLRPASPATHALLRHLEAAGFDGAPRVLGVDEQGREVLSYVVGEAAVQPLQPWAVTDGALVSVARLLRRYHDAVEGFDAAPYAWPRQPPPPYGGGLVSHNDPNTDNVVLRDGQAVAFIDFDLASPGSRLWDLAALARLWVPLRSPVDIPDRRRSRVFARLRLLVDAYGLQEDRADLPAAVICSHDWIYELVYASAEHGHAAFARYLVDGGAGRAARSRRWCIENRALLRRAVVG